MKHLGSLYSEAPRITLGVAYILLLGAPLAAYHHMSAPQSGTIWGYMVPGGYVAALSGLLLVSYSRIGLDHLLRLSGLFLMTGTAVIFVHVVQRVVIETFLVLWTGVSGAYDVDHYSLVSFPTAVGSVSIIIGLVMRRLRNGKVISRP